MSPLVISLIGLAAFLLLMTQGMYIAFAFALVGFIGMVLLRDFSTGLSLLGASPYTWASNGNLLAVPLFVLMGFIVAHSGISQELYKTAHIWVGRFRGGLAHATTLASTGLAACSGVSLASAATMAAVAYPEMDKYKYNRRLSTGCIVAGGSLSCLIPPSTAFIVYGALTETSIGDLFIAGIIPGVLLALCYLSVIAVICRRNPAMGPSGPHRSYREMLASLVGILPVMALLALIMGGLFFGVFTASEAGAMGAFGAFIIAIAKRKVNFNMIKNTLRESLVIISFILTITAGAMIFSNFITVGGFSSMFSGWINSFSVSPHIIMICILLIFIPLGMVMDGLAMLLLTLPIVFPIVKGFGFDPIWFGIVITLLVEMALITPPVGMNTFIVHGITKVPLHDVFIGVIPFFAMMFMVLILLYAFPQISLFLPQLM